MMQGASGYAQGKCIEITTLVQDSSLLRLFAAALWRHGGATPLIPAD
jgi:hypothetical protein